MILRLFAWEDFIKKTALLIFAPQISLKAGMRDEWLGIRLGDIRYQTSDIRHLTSILRPSGIASYIFAAKTPPSFLIPHSSRAFIHNQGAARPRD